MNNETPLSLEQIIARSKRGDVEAFRQLVERYQQYAFALAFRIVCDEEDAKDVVQESFVRVWRHIAKYNHEFRFTTWLYKIVVNIAYDAMKGEARRHRVFAATSECAALEVHDGQSSLEVQSGNRDLATRIRSLCLSLPPKQRLVFVLRDLHDFTVGEVAEILNMSVASVKTNLCYARREIRRRIERMEH